MLGELSRTLVVAYQIPNALARLCAQLAGMLPVSGCWAVVLDELGGELRFVGASDAVGRKVADLHVELGEGPCLEAARTGERVLLPDLGARDAVERFPTSPPRPWPGACRPSTASRCATSTSTSAASGCSTPPQPNSTK